MSELITCAVFDGANLISADFTAASGESVSFRNAVADGMAMSEANCPSADFSGASLMGFTAERAEFIGAKFNRAKLEGGVMTEANIDRADFTGATMLHTVNFDFAHMLQTAVGMNLRVPPNGR
uniref:Pentapeptide repeat-containing protein n=1 Tax=Calcidiscus leptoporus TaxID=127549 RepID=A0A7S0J3G4_9EUKA|mmetsp:Transcript_37206/g.86932  ORF Transcript_37206/g.86932 Transcript_37206/m.86932 type:complete len:123 (+) Transcript_37206:3-371(+)